MSWLSQAKNFVFNSLFAAAARAATNSGSSVVQAAGQQVLASVAPTLQTVAGDVAAGLTQHNSPVGIANVVVGDLETGVKGAVDVFVQSTVGGLPVVGGFIAPEAVSLANAGLDFAEQHLHDYIAALFAHNKAAVNTPAPAPAFVAPLPQP